ncbi:sulfite exporter TauE/SafE family protein [Lewinella sp. W8]|uniref:sulfite exporter TauE/SafE family protein n=1 Tax=Lewinella sp. W8 TaxID=2528208 RepID=UPI0010677E87|nr:sulfite exporter TauE/SafE family protein [Lewinella sp. W8]MTB51990.1 TSUP family transporter [Lewinella sp. W8]
MSFFSEILPTVSPALCCLLFFAGVAAFLFSTVAGGGGALILVPLLNWVLGPIHTAPVLNLGSFLGRPSRLILFWKDIKWSIVLYYAPAAIFGAYVGAWVFSAVRISWLQIFVGLFLISTVWQYRFGKRAQSFPVRAWHFLPLGLLVSVLSTLIGALGPVLNPFYLNLGVSKEEIIATKTANSFLMGLSQLGSYTFFGLLTAQYWAYGIALGLGATLGNILGKRYLKKMSDLTFRRWVIALMVISGGLLIATQVINSIKNYY